jgi:hypothetical protein
MARTNRIEQCAEDDEHHCGELVKQRELLITKLRARPGFRTTKRSAVGLGSLPQMRIIPHHSRASISTSGICHHRNSCSVKSPARP